LSNTAGAPSATSRQATQREVLSAVQETLDVANEKIRDLEDHNAKMNAVQEALDAANEKIRMLEEHITEMSSTPESPPDRLKERELGVAEAQAEGDLAESFHALQSPGNTLSPYIRNTKSSYVERDSRGRERLVISKRAGQTSSHHPDLSDEVTALSNKLVNAINHQTNLEDALSTTRYELEASRERIRQLERENQEHVDLVAKGILIKKSTADLEKAKLTASLSEEKRQRAEVEKEKKKIEQELENLTSALFEEANKVTFIAWNSRWLADSSRW
jgi:Rab guanine nucleotide exchange factor SEC2